MFDYKAGWIIEDKGFERDNEYTKASVFAMCNGYMGNRGTFEEMEPSEGLFVGSYINGIYDAPGNALREREIVNIQDWCLIKLWVDHEPFNITTGSVIDYKRWMDLRESVLHREIKWKSPKGKTVVLKSERFVSIVRNHNALIKWQVETEDDCNIKIESGISADITNIHEYHFKNFISSSCEKYIYLETITKEMGYHIGSACSDIVKTSDGVQFQKKTIVKNKKYLCNQYKADMMKGQSISILKRSAIYTSRDSCIKNIESCCCKSLDDLMDTDYEILKKEHINQWNELWKQCDFRIEGDDLAQIGIRFSIYHLLNSAPYHSSDISFPARSLSGQDHRGSIFWDTEIFIVPFFIYNLPEAAKNMLVYRHKTLDGARRKAKSMGFEGAYFAWESHENGDEKCNSRVFRNPKTNRMIVSHFRDAQIHVSADISYCIWQYYEATNDLDFIIRYGAEILLEVARFFVSRASFDKTRKKYVIKKVLGPDEYHELVDNNTYTNAMAKESIHIAFKAYDLIKKENQKEHEDLCKKINLNDAEMKEWIKVHDKMYIPFPDKKTKLIEQFSGYFKLEDCSVEDALNRKTNPSDYLGGKYGACSKTQIIKQADVIMLLYLMRDRYSNEEKKANWKYYEPRTEQGSSLSPMAYSLVAADIGMVDWSYKFFLRTALMDLEARGFYRNHGVHPCSLAGAWLTAVNGYCGITIKEEGIYWREPHIPKHWEGMNFILKWHDNNIVFHYANKKFEASLETNQKNIRVPFFINGDKKDLTYGEAIILGVET